MTFDIPAIDHSLDLALQSKIDNKTKPLGSLGRLEQIALQIGRIQQTLTPQFSNPHMLIFAADHGAAAAGISAYPQDVTWQMVENYLAGTAGANVFARQNGLKLKVIDGGVAHDFSASDKRGVDFIDAKITTTGTRNYLVEPAMNLEQCAQALATGAKVAHDVADQGCNVLGVGEMGIGNTASAARLARATACASNLRLRASPLSLSPVPRPTQSNSGAPVSAWVINAAEAVLPIPISPTPSTLQP